jgi:hypothetical protein
MAKQAASATQQNRHYPTRQLTGPLHDDFRMLYNHVYSLTDALASAHSRLATIEKSQAQQSAAGSSTTKIGGLYVKAAVPVDGQSLKYSAKSGQIEWTT